MAKAHPAHSEALPTEFKVTVERVAGSRKRMETPGYLPVGGVSAEPEGARFYC